MMAQATRPANPDDQAGRGMSSSVNMGPSGWTPVPDPTALTTDQIRREIAATRELYDARNEIVTVRFDGMDKAVTILQGIADRQPTPSVLQERITALRAEMMQMFQTDSVKFVELDKRTEALTAAGKIAIDAAFKAQQEAASKQEAQFTKQIDQASALTQTSLAGLVGQINDLKSRLDKGEGAGSGRAAQVVAGNRSEDRSSLYITQAIAFGALAIGVVTFILSRMH